MRPADPPPPPHTRPWAAAAAAMATGGWGYSVNPFAGGGSAAPAEEEAPRQQNAFGAWGGGAGAAGAPPPPKPPAGAFSIAPGGSPRGAPPGGGGLAGREAELARREADLARREAALAQLAHAARPVNFPPFCPFIYHSISEQIPAWNRSMVIRFHFVTELVELLAFLWNTVIILAAMFSGIVSLTWWLFSLIALTMGAPLSWLMYYKSLFGAAQTDGATYPYMRSGLCILINIAWCVWMVLGLNGLGEFSGGCVWMVLGLNGLGKFSGGIFPMLRMFQGGDGKRVTFGILYAVNVALWGLAGVGGWFSLGMSIAAYRRGAKPRQDYEARYGPPPPTV
ncbi:MAG: hypothetical protein J3K34DRAFT_486714 [Monoraphidium minutum]|nr:MAG: hypothetical protein J3K34DRAFT_486714 [Monoraphidium minutum]